MWNTLPYILKNDLHQILIDLPPADHLGRSGGPAPSPMAARVASAQVDPEHVRGLLGRDEIVKLRAKYRALPDLYWADHSETVITPHSLCGPWP